MLPATVLPIVLAFAAQAGPKAAPSANATDAFPDAPAVVLLDRESWRVSWTSTERKTERRILIRTSAGYDQADQAVIWDADESKLEGFDARILLPDGASLSVPDDLRREMVVVKNPDIELRALRFTFPRVCPGSILEWSYTLASGKESDVTDWTVQTSIPVVEADLTASYLVPDKTPGALEVDSHGPVAPWCTVGAERREPNARTRTIVCKDLPAIADEALAPPRRDRTLAFLLAWIDPDSVSVDDAGMSVANSRWVARIERGLADKRKTMKLAKTIVAGAKTSSERIDRIWDWVMHHLRAVAPYDNEPDGGTSTVDEIVGRGSASPVERALVTLALARGAGLKAYPLAYADRSEGRFDFTALDTDALVDLLVEIRVPGEPPGLLDPGCRFCQAGIPDWRHSGAGSGGIRVMVYLPLPQRVAGPTVPADFNRVRTSRSVALAPDGTGRVTGSIEWRGQPDQYVRERWDAYTEDGRTADVVERWAGRMDRPTVRTSDPEDLAKNLSAEFSGTDPDAAVALGDRLLIPPPPSPPVAAAIPTEDERRAPLWWRFPWRLDAEADFHIPEGFRVTSVPEDAAVAGPEMRFRSHWAWDADSGTLRWSGTLTREATEIAADRYPEALRFAREVRRAVSRGAVAVRTETQP